MVRPSGVLGARRSPTTGEFAVSVAIARFLLHYSDPGRLPTTETTIAWLTVGNDANAHAARECVDTG
jgi:hypothetical protein